MNVNDLVKWLKDFVSTIVSVAIAYWVAGKPDGTLHWWMILLGVGAAASVTIGTLVRAWSWYRRRPPA